MWLFSMAGRRYLPLPVSVTRWEPFQTLSDTVKVVLRAPELPGANLTVIEQAALAATGAAQLLLTIVKSAEPTPTVPKSRGDGLKLAWGLITFADKGTDCGLPGALSLIFNVAFCGE